MSLPKKTPWKFCPVDGGGGGGKRGQNKPLDFPNFCQLESFFVIPVLATGWRWLCPVNGTESPLCPVDGTNEVSQKGANQNAPTRLEEKWIFLHAILPTIFMHLMLDVGPCGPNIPPPTSPPPTEMATWGRTGDPETPE